MLKKLFLQIASLCAVACLTSAILSAWHVNIIVGFLVGLAFQYAGYYVYKTGLLTYVALKNKKLENERIKELSYQGLEVACPCYKAVKEFIPVRLNAANYYKCSDCKKTISVLITPETAVVTEPVDTSFEAINTVLKQGVQHTYNEKEE
jgi:hypothetical protein